MALATTDETAHQLRKLGCKSVRIVTQCCIHEDLFRKLSTLPDQETHTVRFISIGRPLHWKGFSIGIRAFAASRLINAEYWLILNGGETEQLEILVENLHLKDRVRIIRRLPTLDAVYSALGECHVLIHPALHEAFGNVVLEGMAAGKPVICLDLGGPATQVMPETGIKIPARTTEQVVQDLSSAMIKLAKDSLLRKQMRQAALDRVAFEYLADQVGKKLNKLYSEVIQFLRVESEQSH
jgi:glycosyltransferase involved in cell wall biosynthesis